LIFNKFSSYQQKYQPENFEDQEENFSTRQILKDLNKFSPHASKMKNKQFLRGSIKKLGKFSHFTLYKARATRELRFTLIVHVRAYI
jgi:hypothetical protein